MPSSRFISALLLIYTLSAVPALAQSGSSGASFNLGFPFGGKIITSVPCVSAAGPSLFVTIRPASVPPLPFAFVYTPLTKTQLFGPPLVVGQSVLGLWDTPVFPCKAGVVPLVGARIKMLGTSPPVSGSAPSFTGRGLY